MDLEVASILEFFYAIHWLSVRTVLPWIQIDGRNKFGRCQCIVRANLSWYRMPRCVRRCYLQSVYPILPSNAVDFDHCSVLLLWLVHLMWNYRVICRKCFTCMKPHRTLFLCTSACQRSFPMHYSICLTMIARLSVREWSWYIPTKLKIVKRWSTNGCQPSRRYCTVCSVDIRSFSGVSLFWLFSSFCWHLAPSWLLSHVNWKTKSCLVT